ncbi:hypothetical protein Hanom_Chr08g00702191 [Helianthus anomalus]
MRLNIHICVFMYRYVCDGGGRRERLQVNAEDKDGPRGAVFQSGAVPRQPLVVPHTNWPKLMQIRLD